MLNCTHTGNEYDNIISKIGRQRLLSKIGLSNMIRVGSECEAIRTNSKHTWHMYEVNLNKKLFTLIRHTQYSASTSNKLRTYTSPNEEMINSKAKLSLRQQPHVSHTRKLGNFRSYTYQRMGPSKPLNMGCAYSSLPMKMWTHQTSCTICVYHQHHH